MAIVECFRHWRHYLEGSQNKIEVWSDHQSLQSFMKQPKINGRQARWLILLAPYDFTIRHRPGLLNPADGPSRRPDYLASARKEPSLIQKGLLAKKLAGPDLPLPEAVEPCGLARTIDLPLPEAEGLYDAAEPGPIRPGQSEFQQVAEELCDTAEAGSGLPEVGLYSDTDMGQPIQGPSWPEWQEAQARLPGTARVQLCHTAAFHQSRLWLRAVAEQEPEDKEAGRLLDFVRIQTVTRGMAKKATQDEKPLGEQTSPDLLATIRELQGSDPLCLRLKKELNTDSGREGYTVGRDGLLQYHGRAVVPVQKALTQELLYLYHDDQLAGHWGIDKTKELLERKFYWPGLARDVREYVTTCSTCQNIASPRHKPYGKLEPLPVPCGPWQEVSLDFITQLPSSYIGAKAYDAILVVVDRYTKMAQFIPTTTDIAAPEFAALFHQNIELKYGSPKGIVSDRDTRITSKFWAEVCVYSLIKRRISTAFHPQTDGQTEILNRILENYLRAYTSLEQMNWAKLLPSAEFAYNNSRSSSTKITPFMALYGYNPELRIDVVDTVTPGETPAARDRVVRLQELRNRLQEELLKSQERQAKYYNQRHQPKLFKRNDLVKLSTRNLRLKDKKLQPKWVGPFKILERIGSQAYRLVLPEKYDRLHDVFPVQFIEDYRPREGQPLLPLPDLEEDTEWEVEEVKDKATIDKQIHYLVKWEGWPTEYNQWVPEGDMAQAKQAIQRYEKRQKEKGV